MEAFVTGQGLLVGFAIVAPMVWPQALPHTNLLVTFLPPVPTGPPKPETPKPRTEAAAVIPTRPYRPGPLVEPRSIPNKTPIIIDPGPEIATVSGGMPSGSGMGSGSDNGLINNILGGIPALPAPSSRPVETSRPAPAAAPAAIVRYKVGGVVKLPTLLRRVEPEYPALARQMRISGVVELVGVIGTSGQLRELRVVSGHPLLAHAALQAVSQWLYSQPQLNGDPVEVIAPITVTFRLN